MPVSRQRRRPFSFRPSNARPLDRNLKARILAFARGWNASHREGRQHKGPLTRTFLDVLQALLWRFHNSREGLCIPSYEAIAEAAECARSTVAEAIKALEAAGILSWIHRVRRERSGPPDLLGDATDRLLRSSNSYAFHEVGVSKSEIPTGTLNQASASLPLVRQPPPTAVERPLKDALGAALDRLGRAIAARSGA